MNGTNQNGGNPLTAARVITPTVAREPYASAIQNAASETAECNRLAPAQSFFPVEHETLVSAKRKRGCAV